MAGIELSGLVDPTQPMDPAARRALAAREIRRLGPTPGMPPPPTMPNWTDSIRVQFASLDNETALEILDGVLDPAYSNDPRPAAAGQVIRVFIETAMPGSDLPDRMHSATNCRDALPGHISGARLRGSLWNLTSKRVACPTCMNEPAIAACSEIRGRARQRVNIRTDVLRVLDDLQNGTVHWPAAQRLAAIGTERWAPRFENGYIDNGNPEHWPADPMAARTVELAVAVGQATGQHLAALWDAAMIDVLGRHASRGSSAKVRRKAGRALAAAIAGHGWEELSSVVADEIDTKLTRKKSIEQRVSAVLQGFEPEIGEVVADALDMLEQPGDLFTDWSPKLTDENARDDSVLRSRLIMSWHGGPVPEIVLQAIRTLPD